MTVVAALDRAPDPRPRRTEPTAPSPRQEVTARQIRESSLMLAGRLLSLVVTFLTQVLTVRALSKSDYGAFAYALSVVLLLQWIVPLGLDRADTRFLAIYDERRDYPRLFGVLALETAVVTSLGAVAIAAVLGLRGLLAETLVSNSQAVALLAVMIGLAPLQALDVMVVNVFAVFAKPWSVFLRRYVLEPGLRFVVVAALVLGHRSVHFLATGYLVAGLVGVGLYGALLVRLLARQGLLQHFSLRRIVVPVREVLSFSLPLLLTNVVAVGATELAVVVLGHYRPTAAVAEFRAVQPFAAMNLVVMYSFTTLFTPVAPRLFARSDRAGIRDLYWQTAAWIAVLTFPVLALTTAFARPLTVALLGARYADAANYLALLSVGCYLNAALGFNGLTVQILGRVRYVVVTTAVALVFLLGANLLLVPRLGKLGAVLAVLATGALHNLLKQAGLGFGAGIGVFDRRYAGTYLSIGLTVGGLWLGAAALHPTLPAGAAGVAVATLLVLRVNRRVLRLASTFPELGRIPLLRSVL